jgi:riboflavin kinase/FMN adenylyltransferase
MSLEEELGNLTPDGNTLLTIGVFDGVHRGHRKLLSELINQSRKRNLESGVITFTNHPSSHLASQNIPPLLTSSNEKLALIKTQKVSFVKSLDFSAELAGTSARDFCTLLQRHLNMQGLVLGFDFAMGRNREGSLDKMESLGKEMGFTTAVIPPVIVDGDIVSSTAIRKLINEGNVKQASLMLGRNYSISGTVVTGKRLGRKLGFPTANILINPIFALPPSGIYATIATAQEKRWASVTNIGIAPTFGGSEKLIEVHIFDFDSNLYDERLKIEFVENIRAEITFSGKEELKKQIAQDIISAKTILERTTGSGNE